MYNWYLDVTTEDYDTQFSIVVYRSDDRKFSYGFEKKPIVIFPIDMQENTTRPDSEYVRAAIVEADAYIEYLNHRNERPVKYEANIVAKPFDYDSDVPF